MMQQAFRHLRRAVLAAALLAAGSASAQPIGGDYSVDGTNFDGSRYSGAARITLTSDVTCRIEWQTGGSTSQGICMRSGPVFTAAYQLGDKIGMVIYVARDNGVLEGRWTIDGTNAVGTEVLTPQ